MHATAVLLAFVTVMVFACLCRHIGLLRSLLHNPAAILATVSEVVSRTLKHMLRGRLRELLMPKAHIIGERPSPNHVVADFLNLVTGAARALRDSHSGSASCK